MMTLPSYEHAQQTILVVAPYAPDQSSSHAAESQARMLIHCLIEDSNPSIATPGSQIDWTIKNKYYTALVHFDVVGFPLPVGKLPSLPRRTENEVDAATVRQDGSEAPRYVTEIQTRGCPAIVVSLASVPDAASQHMLLKQLESMVDCADVAISLALAPVAPQSSQGIESEQVQNAFLELGWEYLVLADPTQLNHQSFSSASDEE